jgi:hypothetical protein
LGKGRRLRAIQRVQEERARIEYERAHPSIELRRKREEREELERERRQQNIPGYNCNRIGCRETGVHVHG